MKLIEPAVLLSSAVLLALAACGTPSGGATVPAPAATTQPGGTSAPATTQPADVKPAQPTDGVRPEGTGSADQARPATDPIQPPPLPKLPEGPRVQRSARLSLEVSNGQFDASLDRAIALVQGEGGYIAGSQARADEADRLRSGQVTFMVPAARFDSVLTALRRLGKTESISIAGNDVSQQYVDLQARLRNAEAQRNAMLALMQQARSVNEMIQIQNQLARITEQIEQLKGQIDYLEHTTTFATLTVSIREAAASAQPDEWGLSSAVSRALHNFVNSLNGLIVAIGSLGPVILLAVVALPLGRWLWRRRQQAVPGVSPGQTSQP